MVFEVAAAALEFVASIPLAGRRAIDGRHAADVVRLVHRNNTVQRLSGCETKKQAAGERPVFGESAIGPPLSITVRTLPMETMRSNMRPKAWEPNTILPHCTSAWRRYFFSAIRFFR